VPTDPTAGPSGTPEPVTATAALAASHPPAGPWGSRPFRVVWAGESLSMLGDTAYTVAFAWLVLTVSGSPATLAAVMVAALVPQGLLLLVGGAVTDRVSARTVMAATHLVRAAAIGGLTVVALLGAVRTWHFFAVAVVVGIAEAFFRPAAGAIMPSLVPRTALPRANALLGVSEQTALLAGPVLGGALTAWVGPAAALGADAATFVVAAATVLAAPRRVTEPGGRLRAGEVLTEVRDGLGLVRRRADLRVVLLAVSAQTLTYAGLFAVGLPALARHSPYGAAALGFLVAASGLGQLAGTLAAAATGLPRRWGPLLVGTFLLEGCCLGLLALVPDVRLAALLLAVTAVGTAYATDVALPTYVQNHAAADQLGRVTSLVELPRAILAPLSVAGLGALATTDIRAALAAAALPLLAAGTVMAASRTARGLRVGAA
jgi:MFS family permease